MGRKYKVAIVVVAILALLVAAIWYLSRSSLPVLMPAGTIGAKEQRLILFALGLSLTVVVPVYILLVTFAWKYREGNAKAKYSPHLAGGHLVETVWWLIPTILITILSVVAWRSSHQLDPYRAIAASAKPHDIQVVALDWKWLFIYPEQHIASVNFVEFPANTPIVFHITSDAPMNSFWIPSLGGQIYAMPGMSTQLHLLADKTGSFHGSSANISGDGFADMFFTARASSQAGFGQWVKTVKKSPKYLGQNTYGQLAHPSRHVGITYYSSVQNGLYSTIIAKYMAPSSNRGSYQVAPAANTYQARGL